MGGFWRTGAYRLRRIDSVDRIDRRVGLEGQKDRVGQSRHTVGYCDKSERRVFGDWQCRRDGCGDRCIDQQFAMENVGPCSGRHEHRLVARWKDLIILIEGSDGQIV